jgi:hypothetical protein
MTKAQQAERNDAIEKLRGWLKPGDTVYTILDHVSASGMSRAIRVVIPTIDRHNDEQKPATVYFLHPNYAIGQALGLKHWKRDGREQDALVLSGCGMDMGFELVYRLGRTLFPDGFKVEGRGRNGDTSGWDQDGGYALNHRWL